MDQKRRMSGFIRYVNNYRYLVEFRKNQWLKTPELERIQEKKLYVQFNIFTNICFK